MIPRRTRQPADVETITMATITPGRGDRSVERSRDQRSDPRARWNLIDRLQPGGVYDVTNQIFKRRTFISRVQFPLFLGCFLKRHWCSALRAIVALDRTTADMRAELAVWRWKSRRPLLCGRKFERIESRELSFWCKRREKQTFKVIFNSMPGSVRSSCDFVYLCK